MGNVPTVSHNEGTPGGSDYIRDGDDRIIEFKTQVREIIAVDHKMDSSGQGTTWGMHKMATFIQGASPTAVADTNILFSEDVSSVPQIKCKHEAGYEEQITGIGKYDQNVIIQATSDTAVDADALQINIQGQVEASLNVTIDGSTTGADALDTGSLGASTIYYVWVIYDTTNSTAAGLLSASSTTPTMPANYVLKRLIGYAFTDADSDLLKSYQFMNRFMYDIPVNMTTTNPGTGTWSSALDCSAAIPSGVRMGIFGLYTKAAAAANAIAVYIRPNGSTWAAQKENGITFQETPSKSYISGQRTCMTDSSQQIQYYVYGTTADVTIDVEGFICGLF